MTPLLPRILNLFGALVSVPWLVVAGLPQIPDLIASWFSAPTNQILGIWDIPGIVNYTVDILVVGIFQVLPIFGAMAALIISIGQLIKPFAVSVQYLSHLIWAKSLVPVIGLFIFQAFRPELLAYVHILLHFFIGPALAVVALIVSNLQKPSEKQSDL